VARVRVDVVVSVAERCEDAADPPSVVTDPNTIDPLALTVPSPAIDPRVREEVDAVAPVVPDPLPAVALALPSEK
jgi:hypothetical protein